MKRRIFSVLVVLIVGYTSSIVLKAGFQNSGNESDLENRKRLELKAEVQIKYLIWRIDGIKK